MISLVVSDDYFFFFNVISYQVYSGFKIVLFFFFNFKLLILYWGIAD